ncbi:catalase family peroxidase [Asaia lannensis]|uniref:Catalase-related peroxidase n=1 Tax=Asaia lannensis NBRC 102526 TaxID=1307926 RepID=A0ABT1CCR3_9PROT|nr:catalase family peroxidase [Asaia lannensis]MCO6158645.1 catalase family peroxidase [Asaia lannensis NBRC 102526]
MAQTPPGPSAGLARWLGVASLPCILLAGFAFAGGWFSPHRLTPDTLIAALQGVDGRHPGFRRNHAKGVCVAGWFEGNGAATAYSTASFFSSHRVPVIGRFALAGGMPYQADAPGKVRSLALSLREADGQEWRMGINDIPLFPVSTPADFQALQQALRPDPGTGKPDPVRMTAFRAAHPHFAEAGAALAARPITSGFENDTYRSLDSFLLHDGKGAVTPMRFAMVPVAMTPATTPVAGSIPSAPLSETGENALFVQLAKTLSAHPLRWRLVITLAGPGDTIDDPSRVWSAQDRQIEAGTLTLDKIDSEETGACTGITFDPLVLPDGIGASNDPVLQARSATYMRSFAERSREPAPRPAITPAVLHQKEQEKAS